MPSKVIIIDYGSQVTQLIARRVREAGVYSEIHPCVVTAAQVKAMQPSAIILSGGPASVGEKDAPALDKGFLDLGVPVLGICYGMQLLAFNLGGGLEQSETREYGPADLRFVRSCALWDGIDLTKLSRVWMSHGDTVKTPPAGFLVTGSTDTLEVAAMADEARKIYAVQFHPEVHHSVDGDTMLRNFLFKIAKITPDEIQIMKNGGNEDGIILDGSRKMKPLKFLPDADLEEADRLLVDLLVGNMTCPQGDRFLILSWLSCFLLIDFAGTRPMTRFEGSAGSGKTTASKITSTLLYGEPQHKKATDAANYTDGSQNPLIVLDNIEVKQMTEDLTTFMLTSITGIAKEKRKSGTDSETITERTKCLLNTTGIEPLCGAILERAAAKVETL